MSLVTFKLEETKAQYLIDILDLWIDEAEGEGVAAITNDDIYINLEDMMTGALKATELVTSAKEIREDLFVAMESRSL